MVSKAELSTVDKEQGIPTKTVRCVCVCVCVCARARVLVCCFTVHVHVLSIVISLCLKCTSDVSNNPTLSTSI